jgi:hypothetical protein
MYDSDTMSHTSICQERARDLLWELLREATHACFCFNVRAYDPLCTRLDVKFV